MTLASEGEVTPQELLEAYHALGIDLRHAKALNDHHIVSAYHARLPDAGLSEQKRMREALQQIAGHRKSAMIRSALTERKVTVITSLKCSSANPTTVMDFDQALNWLGVLRDTDPNTIWACKVEKVRAFVKVVTRSR